MKNENTTLTKNLQAIMKKAQTDTVAPAPPATPPPEAVDNVNEELSGGKVGDPGKEISKSVKMIRSSLRKAELGDQSAVSRIESELVAIERALKRASKFNSM